METGSSNHQLLESAAKSKLLEDFSGGGSTCGGEGIVNILSQNRDWPKSWCSCLCRGVFSKQVFLHVLIMNHVTKTKVTIEYFYLMLLKTTCEFFVFIPDSPGILEFIFRNIFRVLLGEY